MSKYDQTTSIQAPFSTKAKVHYLNHLEKDICHFGCALHFETEKGEMFNKFIREQLFHTNRSNPSRNVAEELARQAILKHVVDGGSWIDKCNKRAKYGKQIEQFVRSYESNFREVFLGAREFAENNCATVNETPSVGFRGVFKASGSGYGCP